MKIFLVKYSINVWLDFTNNKLHRRISWSTHFSKPTHGTRLFSNNPFFYSNPPKNISNKFISLESFEGFYNQVWSQWLIKLFNVNYERKHKLIVDLWMLIIDASNFTLYSISFILESLLLFAKHFLYQNFS